MCQRLDQTENTLKARVVNITINNVTQGSLFLGIIITTTIVIVKRKYYYQTMDPSYSNYSGLDNFARNDDDEQAIFEEETTAV